MLDKLYDMGILGECIDRQSLELLGRADAQFDTRLTVANADTGTKPSDIETKVTVSAFARRRLAVVITRMKMAETVSDVSLGALCLIGIPMLTMCFARLSRRSSKDTSE